MQQSERRKKEFPLLQLQQVEYSNYLTTKHRDGLKLKDVADVVLDNCCIIGDAGSRN